MKDEHNPLAADGETRAATKDDDKAKPAPADDKPAERPQPVPEGQPPLGESHRAAQEAIAVERQRTAAITGLCARHGMSETAAEFIVRGDTLDQVRAAILDTLATRSDGYGRRQEPLAAAPRVGDQRQVEFRSAVADAIMHRINPRASLPDAAREFRGMRMHEIARACAERAGVDTRGMYPHQVIEAALQARAAVGYHTTSDFALIVSDVMNKTLREAYEETPRSFTEWARRTTAKDFRPAMRAVGWGAPDLLKVNEAGEFQYGTVTGEGETIALQTYGRIIAFTRQLIINDDMNVLGRIPQQFGASAADLESDIVYGILLANPVMSDGVALFHATHGNLGVAAQITDASLAAAMLAFATGKNKDGRYVRVVPKYLIVPPGPREMEARRVLTQTTPTKSADVNVYANSGLQIVVEPRLIPATGQHPWFLAADPTRVDTIDYAYLEGEEGVTTTTRTGFEVDGVEHKARIDFGAAAMDYHGLYKNPGAAPS